MIGILIIAGVRFYREGLARLLAREQDVTVVGAFASGDDLERSSPLFDADVILVDKSTLDAEDTTRLREVAGSAPWVAIGVADSEADILACMEAGAAAYVTRDGSIEDLVAAVRNATRGELMCSPRVARALGRRVAELMGEREETKSVSLRLTRREREIARLIQSDLSNKEIATQLSIEVATVKNHVHNLLDKLQVRSRLEISRTLLRKSG